jgi:hypothetical protein
MERLTEPTQPGSIDRVTDAAASLTEQLEEIGAQLSWVRDYL